MTIGEKLCWVGIGGAIGATGRFFIAQWAVQLWGGKGFPYGTLIVNIVGSFLLGGLVALTLEKSLFSPRVFVFLGAGFCGAFTTMSTLSMETLQLSHDGAIGLAVTNMLLNNILSLCAAFGGMMMIRAWT